MISYNFSLLASDTFFESLTPSIIEFSGKTTHATTTGPAKGPRPASSIPAMYFTPFSKNSLSIFFNSISLASSFSFII